MPIGDLLSQELYDGQAVDTDSPVPSSRAAKSCMVGTLTAVGFKLGRWVDTVLMQRPLGPGSGSLPAASGYEDPRP